MSTRDLDGRVFFLRKCLDIQSGLTSSDYNQIKPNPRIPLYRLRAANEKVIKGHLKLRHTKLRNVLTQRVHFQFHFTFFYISKMALEIHVFLTPICKLWTKNPQTGYIVERHLWTKNPHEIQNFVFGDVVERHLWTKNPHKFFFKKIKNHLLGISWSVICGQKNHTEFPKY